MDDGFTSDQARKAFFAWQDVQKRKGLTPGGKIPWRQWWREKFAAQEAEVMAKLEGDE